MEDQLDDIFDEESNEIHLRYEDIIPYLPPDPPETLNNNDVGEYLKSIKERTQKFYVSRVNALYNILKGIWPNGTPIDYYISYEYFTNISEKEYIKKMAEPNTIKMITELVSLRKQGKYFPNQNTQQSSSSNQAGSAIDHNFSDSEDDDEDGDFSRDEIPHKKKKKKSYWKESEISTFIKLLSKSNHLKSWKAVSHNFKNKTQNDCFSLYQKLLEDGEITSKYAPKKEPKIKNESEEELDITPYESVKAIFFEFNDQRSIVGPQSDLNKEKARNSPFYGHEDLITADVMFLPTISDYGTVLDYDTWLRIIQNTQRDPFETKPILNKRQITVLTKENFPQYKSLVRKVGEKKQ